MNMNKYKHINKQSSYILYMHTNILEDNFGDDSYSESSHNSDAAKVK